MEQGDYLLFVKCPLRGNYVATMEILATIPPLDKPQKTREDQQFRLMGTVSTSHLKVLEIIIKEGIKVEGTAVTIAEGEGSIAKLLVDLGADKVYHNTLVNKDKLVPQHGINFIPACLVEDGEKVFMGVANSVTGGDITGPDVLGVLECYLDMEVNGVCIVTCDAESPSDFNPKLTVRIASSWLFTCICGRAKAGLFKLFCVSDEITTLLLGMTQCVFENVKIVVTTFSSHENHETYIVATGFNPMVNRDVMRGSALGDTPPSFVAGIQALTPSIGLLKSRRIHPDPLQKLDFGLTVQLWRSAQARNVVDNLIHSFNRVTGGVNYNCNVGLKENLRRAKQLLTDQLVVMIKNQVEPYYGVLTIQSPCMSTRRPGTLHHSIENSLDMLAVVSVLIKSLEIDDSKLLCLKMDEWLSQDIILMADRTVVYQYKIPLTKFYYWYVKYFWRIWGHWKWRYHHNCVPGVTAE